MSAFLKGLITLGLFLVICSLSLFPSAQGAERKGGMEMEKVKDLLPFELEDVRLLDSPFKEAMERDAEYLLKLEPDRLLAGFREEAGLLPKAPKYGGWEQTQVAGHTLGHYLTACSLMYADTRDERFRQRVLHIVDELEECQKAHGDGYVSAIPGGKRMFQELAKGDLEPYSRFWAPWYVVHKLFAGLLDAHRYCGSGKALEIARRLADWVEATLANLNEEQIQRMLDNEHGGMMESLAELYARTGEERYLKLAGRFYHRAIMDPLANGVDCLPGLHGNTQIPKVIGSARLYELTGERTYRVIAEFFWDRVVHHHAYVIGGVTDNEVFGPPDKLNDRLGLNTCETCKTYNILKLTKHIFSWDPSAEVADYYERALYNHILASQNPADGMMCYYIPMLPGAYKVYSTPYDSFWCCVGTGMENHARYGEFIYFHSDEELVVNLYIPSEVTWKEKGLKVRMETRFPESDKVTLRFRCQKPVSLILSLRCPGWLADLPQVKVNGKELNASARPGSYLSIKREWREGDVVELRLPMSFHTESLPDNPSRKAFLYGPIVLSGDLGAIEEEVVVPALVAGNIPFPQWLKPVEGQPLTFRTEGVGKPKDVLLIPFYKMHNRRYTIYFEFLSEEEWRRREEERRKEEEQLKDWERRTIDWVEIGNEASEGKHNLQGERMGSGAFMGRRWRHAVEGGWFSYDLRVEEGEMELVCTYWGSDVGPRTFDIVVEGEVIATQTLNNNQPGRFFSVVYKIPPHLTQGNEKITVRFQAHPSCIAGGLFGLRLLRGK